MGAGAVIASIAAGVAYLAFAVQSVLLGIVDARTHRLPDRLVLPGYPIAAVLLTIACVAAGTPERLLPVGGGAACLFGFYLILRLLRPGAMGGGDVKLAGVVGGYLGFFGWECVLLGAVSGFVLGGLFGVILILARRARAGTAIPFGPFLLAGAWLALVAAWVGR